MCSNPLAWWREAPHCPQTKYARANPPRSAKRAATSQASFLAPSQQRRHCLQRGQPSKSQHAGGSVVALLLGRGMQHSSSSCDHTHCSCTAPCHASITKQGSAAAARNAERHLTAPAHRPTMLTSAPRVPHALGWNHARHASTHRSRGSPCWQHLHCQQEHVRCRTTSPPLEELQAQHKGSGGPQHRV